MPHHPTSPFRRLLLQGAAALSLIGSLPSSAWSVVRGQFYTRFVEENVVFDADSGTVHYPDGHQEPYTLTIDGLVDSPLTLSYTELRAMAAQSQTSDFHCVEGWSVYGINWSGIRPKALLDLVAPKAQAKYVVFHALGPVTRGPVDHYVESYALQDLTDPGQQHLLALDVDGAPLPHKRGAPLRLVAPFDLAYKSIKAVTRIELTDHAVEGWWTQANPVYPWDAPVSEDRLGRVHPRAD